MGVLVGVAVGTGVAVGVAVGRGVDVGVAVGSGVAVGVGVGSGVLVGVAVGNGVGVAVAVGVGVAVGVEVGVAVGVGVGVAPLPILPSLRMRPSGAHSLSAFLMRHPSYSWAPSCTVQPPMSRPFISTSATLKRSVKWTCGPVEKPPQSVAPAAVPRRSPRLTVCPFVMATLVRW
jgi:hypothetical protein